MLHFAVDNEWLFYELFTVALSRVDVNLQPHNPAIKSPTTGEKIDIRSSVGALVLNGRKS